MTPIDADPIRPAETDEEPALETERSAMTCLWVAVAVLGWLVAAIMAVVLRRAG